MTAADLLAKILAYAAWTFVLIFSVLKIIGDVQWPWLWIWAPLWMPCAIILVAVALFADQKVSKDHF